jgi:hypothetical protein
MSYNISSSARSIKKVEGVCSFLDTGVPNSLYLMVMVYDVTNYLIKGEITK